MGLWNWLFDLLSQEPAGGRSTAPRSDLPKERRSDGAVATLERPAPAAAYGTIGDRWWAPQGESVLEPPPLVPPQDTETLALESLLLSHFDGHDLNMPPLMQVAERVLGRLRDARCDLADVAREIADDQVMAAAVLRMANSPLYRGMHKITALPPAVTRLGIKALRMLMMHESLKSAVFHGKGRNAELAQLLWTRSLASAHIMRGLSRFTRVDEEEAFLIGLLHDIGGVIVLRILLGDRSVVSEGLDVDSFEYLCAETHQEFGELVAEAWKLPETLKSLISNHHAYPQTDDPLRAERLQLLLCDMIGALLGYGPFVPYDLLNTQAARELNLTDRRDFAEFLETLPGRIEEAFDAF